MSSLEGTWSLGRVTQPWSENVYAFSKHVLLVVDCHSLAVALENLLPLGLTQVFEYKGTKYVSLVTDENGVSLEM